LHRASHHHPYLGRSATTRARREARPMSGGPTWGHRPERRAGDDTRSNADSQRLQAETLEARPSQIDVNGRAPPPPRGKRHSAPRQRLVKVVQAGWQKKVRSPRGGQLERTGSEASSVAAEGACRGYYPGPKESQAEEGEQRRWGPVAQGTGYVFHLTPPGSTPETNAPASARRHDRTGSARPMPARTLLASRRAFRFTPANGAALLVACRQPSLA
jgi:hypothetical protein